MKIQCDVCEKQEASVFCAADEAALCEGCDYNVHHANKLASKHHRFSLLHPSFKEAPLCDICQEKRAFLFCREDRAILCRDCDISIHKANEHTQNHNRFLLTGVKISACSADYPSCSSTSSGLNSMSTYDDDDMINQHSYTKTPLSTTYNQIKEDNSISSSNTISEYLMDTLPGWRLEDLLDSSSASHFLFKTTDYTNMNPVNTTQQMEESMGRFGSESEAKMCEFYHQGPLVPSYLPANFLQKF